MDISQIFEKIHRFNNYLLGKEPIPQEMLKKEMYFGHGIPFNSNVSEMRITVPDVNRSGHFWCFGTTRVGKTRLLENLVEEDIRKGYDVIVIDPKGDNELFSKIAQVAIDAGRQDDLMLCNPVYPEYSIKINPLEYYSMKEELAGHVLAAVPDGKEPFFKNVAYETTINAVTGVIRLAQLKKESQILTFEDLKNITNKTGLDKLLAELDAYNDEETLEVKSNLSKVAESEKDYFSKISSSLRVALMELTMGNTGEIIGKVRGNEVIKRLEDSAYGEGYVDGKRKGVIFVVQAGALLTERAARTIGKVFISSIAKLAGRVFAAGKKLQVPLCLYIDEAQSMLYGGIDDLFAKAGGAGVWVHCFSQSINQIYNEMPSKDAGKAILDNTNTKVFMRAPDIETAANVAEFFGEEKKYSPVFSTNSGSLTIRESIENKISPQDILELDKQQFYLTTYTGMYKGKVRTVSPLYLQIDYPRSTIITDN